MRIANRRFEITDLTVENSLHLVAQRTVLGAHLTPYGKVRTSEGGAAFAATFLEQAVGKIEVALESLQGRHRWGEDHVHFGPLFLPVRLQCCYREFRFRFEEIIKAPLLRAGPVANRIDGGRAIAVLPNEIHRGLLQSLFHVTDSRHTGYLHGLDRPVNYLFRFSAAGAW